MEYRFFLNELEIEEPIGWADFELSMNRDDVYHGMQFEVSTGTLEFYGVAANYLKEQKDLYGIQANVTFIAEEACPQGEYTNIVTGRLNFGKYKDTCGIRKCNVIVPFEEQGCKVIFNSRFDQKVDLENTFAKDNVSLLPNYAQLGQTITMPPVALEAATAGRVANANYIQECSFIFSNPSATVFVRPDYEREDSNTIDTGQLIGINNMESSLGPEQTTCVNGPLTPQLLLEEELEGITCFDGEFNYYSRMKGTINLSDYGGDGTALVQSLKHLIIKWDGASGSIISNGVLIQESIIGDYSADPIGPPTSIIFDDEVSGTEALVNGEGFYAVLELILIAGEGLNNGITVQIVYNPETEVTVQAIRLCPETTTQYFMIHETLSRVVESITNRCARVMSEYYGRIDSQPFAFDADGCGSLRMLTSGLKLRNAPDGKFFASAKDLLSGLNAIDNIGFDFAPDPQINGRYVVRVEQMDFFYKDQQMILLSNVPVINNEVQETWHYAKIDVGYKKWEVEQVNGLNEFNSNREYRTNIETISTGLDITSNLVAGSIPIEVTRQQTFADSGAADTEYDNDTFIICLVRSAYQFLVEQGNILDDTNIFDANTALNFRITPARNLMRWFKSIVNSYAQPGGSSSSLFFNSGTGNYLASGLLDDATDCRLEAFAITESQTFNLTTFADQAKGMPILKNETAAFDYPLSTAQYNEIKANPYGYIAYTCGTDSTIQKGFIKEIKFKPARGTANFTLRKKYETS